MNRRSHTDRAKGARRAAAASRAAGGTRLRRPAARGPATRRPAASAPPRAKRAATGGAVLALPRDCTLAAAEGLRLQLARLLKRAGLVRLDISGVRRIDSASLQLLAAFVRDRRVAALPVALTGESPAFTEGAWLVGLAPLLGHTASLGVARPAGPTARPIEPAARCGSPE